MESGFEVVAEDDQIVLRSRRLQEDVASLVPREWETTFFDRAFAWVEFFPPVLAQLEHDERFALTDLIASKSDDKAYAMVGCDLDAGGIALAPALEESGFRLVDTRITFLTLSVNMDLARFTPDLGEVAWAGGDDLPAILRLTHANLTDNPDWHSRYKNTTYFSPQECRNYYTAWIENHIKDPDSLFAVWRVEGNVVGYFLYKKGGQREGEQVYKGILAAVDPAYRGRKGHLFMQSYLYDHMPEKRFWLDNTTQLSNPAVIANHITSQKKLGRIEFTFFRNAASQAGSSD